MFLHVIEKDVVRAQGSTDGGTRSIGARYKVGWQGSGVWGRKLRGWKYQRIKGRYRDS